MNSREKLRRKPTVEAVFVGLVCFLLSLGAVGFVGFLMLLAIKQVSQPYGTLLFWIGPLPLVIAVIWMTVFLMDLYENSTGRTLRTRSARKSKGKSISDHSWRFGSCDLQRLLHQYEARSGKPYRKIRFQWFSVSDRVQSHISNFNQGNQAWAMMV